MKKVGKVFIFSFLVFHTCFSFGFIQNKNNSEWPYIINSDKSFDIASKCEMLVFVEIFNEYDIIPENSYAKILGVKNSYNISIERWKRETKKRILFNFKQLSKESLQDVIKVSSINSWEAISKVEIEKVIENDLRNWYKSTKLFYRNYIKEQLRLAALYPRITSEILQLSENEIQGYNFADKNFLLTFDDGPTKVNGNTDKLIEILDTHKLTGMFFVLGDNLEKRYKASSKSNLRTLYKNHKVYSHGKVHKSHQRYSSWSTSINYTNALINEVFDVRNENKFVYFRPPYGQRNRKVTHYLETKKTKLIFWNIDSRDWSSKLNAEQVATRQIKLMLLWRKGILLFHDIHRKAQKSVPIIHEYFKNNTINWLKSNEVTFE